MIAWQGLLDFDYTPIHPSTIPTSRQPIQFIHQPVNLPIRRGDLAWKHGLFGGRVRGGELLMQVEHGLDEGDHPVVAGDIGGIGEVDRADGKVTKILTKETQIYSPTTF
jgi:hypothetical protein